MHVVSKAVVTRIAFGLLSCSSFVTGSLTSDYEAQRNAENVSTGQTQSRKCRCFPTDACWPSEAAWSEFNKTVDGRLIATIPLASSCHQDAFSPYNKQKCKILQAAWLNPETHYVDSASVMAPFFANRSCDPFLPKPYQCVVGTYVSYAVNVSRPAHVSKTIRFATKNNIRLVIRNTGHDYNGKSTGAGAIGLWMHHLKDIQIMNYKSRHFTGRAIKMGAGVQGFEAYQAAHQNGLQVVGGECPTVGIAGGYTQGGGHSALASKYGLAADQALEWEVIDGTGRLWTVSRYKNPDLFFALSGGGGGTYGVVISLTSKVHLDIPVSGANLTFTSKGVSQDVFYDAIATYHANLPAIVDAGAMSVWYFTNESFTISPITGPGIRVDELRRLMRPFTNRLDELGIKYTQTVRQFKGYFEQFNAMQSPIQVGIAQYGGRLIPRSVVRHRNKELTEAYRFINHYGGQFIGVGLNVSRAVTGNVYNSVNPAWRDTLIDTVITTPWNFNAPLHEMIENQRKMTDVFIPRLEVLTPNGGCYLNEGDFRQPNFAKVFYGGHYAKLLRIKNKYDPNHIFYATTAVGSEYWSVQPDKRLCRNQQADEPLRA